MADSTAPAELFLYYPKGAPGRCTCYLGTIRCKNEAAVWIFAPDGSPVPGCARCRECADRTIREYREKLGEEWTTKDLIPV